MVEARERTGAAGRMRRHPLFWPVVAVTLILVGWALRAMMAVVLPLVCAFFVAIVIAPLDRFVRQALPPSLRWVGHGVSMLALVVILGLFFTGIGMAAQQVLQKFPADIGAMLDEGGAEAPEVPLAGQADASRPDAERDQAAAEAARAAAESPEPPQDPRSPASLGKDGFTGHLAGVRDTLGQMLRERGTSYAGAVVNQGVAFLSGLVLILFLSLFLLIEAPNWRDKALTLLDDGEESDWREAISATAKGVRWFLLVKAGLGGFTAMLYAGWLAVMGVDLIFTWAIVTFLLNFIPTIGSMISGLLAAAYAFYALGPGEAAAVALGLLAIEQVMGNFVEPRFLGRQLALSPLVVLVSLVLWGWMWGIAGALLATPMLILIVTVAAHVRALEPIAIVLTEEGRASLRRIRGL